MKAFALVMEVVGVSITSTVNELLACSLMNVVVIPGEVRQAGTRVRRQVAVGGCKTKSSRWKNYHSANAMVNRDLKRLYNKSFVCNFIWLIFHPVCVLLRMYHFCHLEGVNQWRIPRAHQLWWLVWENLALNNSANTFSDNANQLTGQLIYNNWKQFVMYFGHSRIAIW